MDITQFMQGYKESWVAGDTAMFSMLFLPDGEYHNTPFQCQRGTAALVEYWKRVQMHEDVQFSFDVLSSTPDFGVAHWHVTYQVTSEELFKIWAQSTGTPMLARKEGDPLPRIALDGILKASFVGDRCKEARIWWHSLSLPLKEAS